VLQSSLFSAANSDTKVLVVLSQNLRAYLFLTITTLCFGMNANFGKLAVGEVSPMLLVSLRWIGTVVLLLFFAGQKFISETGCF